MSQTNHFSTALAYYTDNKATGYTYRQNLPTKHNKTTYGINLTNM